MRGGQLAGEPVRIRLDLRLDASEGIALFLGFESAD